MHRLFLVVWMWALCAPSALLAQGGEQARLEAERKAISDRIAATQSLLQSTRDDKARSTQEWAVLKEQLSLRQQLLSNLRAERRAAGCPSANPACTPQTASSQTSRKSMPA